MESNQLSRERETNKKTKKKKKKKKRGDKRHRKTQPPLSLSLAVTSARQPRKSPTEEMSQPCACLVEKVEARVVLRPPPTTRRTPAAEAPSSELARLASGRLRERSAIRRPVDYLAAEARIAPSTPAVTVIPISTGCSRNAFRLTEKPLPSRPNSSEQLSCQPRRHSTGRCYDEVLLSTY